MTEDYLDEVSQAFLSHCGRGLMLHLLEIERL